jgi:hypothetical protein
MDAIERRIRQPGPLHAHGEVRDELLRRRRAAEELLADADRSISDLLERRRALVAIRRPQLWVSAR